MSPKIAKSLYQLGTVVSAILGLVLIWGGIDAGTAASIDQIVAGLVALIPGASSAVAERRVTNQTKDGLFKDIDPVEAVRNGVEEVLVRRGQAETAVHQAREAVESLIGVDVGPLLKEILK